MSQPTTTNLPLTIGLDLGSRLTQCAVLNPEGTRIEERKISTNEPRLRQLFERFPGARVVMEASTPARWVRNLAREMGHDVIVANPRRIPIITASTRKSDRNDARMLADLGQVRPHLLSPVKLREDVYQRARVVLFARAQLVKQRTALVTFVRAEVKAVGKAFPACSARSFVSKARPLVPQELTDALDSILEVIELVSSKIDQHDKHIERLSRETFPQTEVLRQVHGVGPLVALAFVATIGAPDRFAKSRSVGAYLGLVPRLDQSCAYDPDLGIAKTGDGFLRSLLVSSATRILGPFGPDSDLRRYGERITAQGGKRAKARARVAVARKLAVLLHRLLVTGEVYEPLRNSEAADS